MVLRKSVTSPSIRLVRVALLAHLFSSWIDRVVQVKSCELLETPKILLKGEIDFETK